MNSPNTIIDWSLSPDKLVIDPIAFPQRHPSKTMELDKSQPPTPDGSGRPANFQVIAPDLYRSSYPSFAHFNHLADLELKTIITLVSEPIDYAYANFISTNGITHHQIPILANKDPAKFTDKETIGKVLEIMFEPSNYPLLVHCNKGKHRTGCVTACFRRVCGWTLEGALEEYVKYSTPKDRPLDKVFIQNYNELDLKPIAFERGYIGGVYQEPPGDSATSTSSSCYTHVTIGSDTTDDDNYPGIEYQELAKQRNNAAMESARLWSHR